MPDWAESLAQLTPTLHAFDGLRDAFFGGSWADEALALALFAAIALPVSLALFAAAMHHVRRTGNLYRP
jgi:ABC-type polysaccharide/polyol phosphate export permease